MSDIATIEPARIRAGDTITWKKSLSDYPASAGWVLKYYLVNATSKITITSSADGDDHLVSVDAATSAAYAPGEYSWTSRVEKGGENHSIATGTMQVLPDLSAATVYDGRTHAKKALDAIEAVLEQRATQSDLETQIGDRRLRSIPFSELLALRDYYRREVAKERAAEKAANGLATGKKVLVRFE